MLNKFREVVAEKGGAVGTFLGVTNVPMLECLGYTGLDFVIIDTEHGPYDTQPMSDLIKTAELAGMAPIVRVADVTHKEIQRAVDNGAQSIIIPCLREVDDFKKAVDLTKFAPVGNRGFIKARGCGFGNEPWANGSIEDYMKNSNERVLLLPQCETQEALDHIEEIAAIEGLDGIFIGPFDLSICMGIPAQFDHPDFKAAIARIFKACTDAGKLCLIFTNKIEDARRYLEAGFHGVAHDVDMNIYTAAFRKLVGEIRA